MRIHVEPFEREKHLDEAAALLAARHARDRARLPMLPAAYEDAAACRTEIEAVLAEPGYGVAASSDGRVVGFGVMTSQLIAPTHFLASFFPPRGVSLGYTAHAVVAGMEYDAYREIYGALADYYVERGYFQHAVNLSAADPAARDAFESLGFGRALTAAIRDVAPVERAPATVDVHQAGAEDAEIIYGLNEELMLYHARTPIFQPFLRESDASSHEFQRNILGDAANAHWVAYEAGRPLGMNTFMAPFFLPHLLVPEKTVYLFQGIVTGDARAGGVGSALLSRGVAWAREQGYEHVALHFASANIQGANFWQGSGFRSVEHRMRRAIDERIAWANQ